MFKNSILTSKKIRISLPQRSQFNVVTDIIALYSEKHTKAMDTLCGQTAELTARE